MLNDTYSFKDFTGQSLLDVPVEELNSTTIKGSCFAQESRGYAVTFRAALTGVIFEGCNLDNVFIPPGNIIADDCCHRRILVQKDGQDWLVDETLTPIEPLNKALIFTEGGNVDPTKIPLKYIVEDRIRSDLYDAQFPGNTVAASSWYREVPTVVSTQIVKVSVNITKAAHEEMLTTREYAPFIGNPKAHDVEDSKGVIVPGFVGLIGFIKIYAVSGEHWVNKRLGV